MLLDTLICEDKKQFEICISHIFKKFMYCSVTHLTRIIL